MLLNEMTDAMIKIKVINHTRNVPFQKGIIVTNKSLQNLLVYLKEKYSNNEFTMKYILTNRLNQDVLENFFPS